MYRRHWKANVIELHKFLYGDETYTPSATVLANSEKILEIVGGESSLDDKQATVEENTANDTVIFEKNGSGWSDTSNNYDSDDSGSADSSDGSSGGGNTDYDPDNSGGSSSGDDGSGGDYVQAETPVVMTVLAEILSSVRRTTRSERGG